LALTGTPEPKCALLISAPFLAFRITAVPVLGGLRALARSAGFSDM